MIRDQKDVPPRLVPVILVTCTWVSVLSTDLYLPSLPHLPEQFGTTEQAVKWTLSFNLIAYALAQLFHGPVSDRFGRRAVLLSTVSVFGLASVLCAVASSIEMLIFARFLQGCLSSAPSVIVVLIIHELYDRGTAVRVLGFHGLAVGIAPILGPIIGGYIFIALGWRANFWVLVVAGIVTAALVWRHIPETQNKPKPLYSRAVITRYCHILSHQRTLGYLLILMCSTGILFAFITNGPFLYIDHFGVLTQHFGYYLGAVMLAYAMGGLIAIQLGHCFDTDFLMKGAFALIVLGTTGFGLLVWSGTESAMTITAAMMVFCVGMGLTNATVPILVLESVEAESRGVASAAAGSLQHAAAGVASFLVVAVSSNPAIGSTVVMLGLMALGSAGFLLLSRSGVP